MAIDTANKRRSVWIGCGRTSIAPIPDGAIDTQDRAQARWVYRGITYDPPPVVVSLFVAIKPFLFYRRRG